MAELQGAGIRSGRWQAKLVAPGHSSPPDLVVLHHGHPLDGVALVAGTAPGEWQVSVPIPVTLLSDGVQTFIVEDRGAGTRLGVFTIVTGVPLDDDIRAELDLMRSELELLKQAFRRHCNETRES